MSAGRNEIRESDECGTSCLDPSEVRQAGEARDDEREND